VESVSFLLSEVFFLSDAGFNCGRELVASSSEEYCVALEVAAMLDRGCLKMPKLLPKCQTHKKDLHEKSTWTSYEAVCSMISYVPLPLSPIEQYTTVSIRSYLIYPFGARFSIPCYGSLVVPGQPLRLQMNDWTRQHDRIRRTEDHSSRNLPNALHKGREARTVFRSACGNSLGIWVDCGLRSIDRVWGQL
jgi:hypothetical protein